MPPAIATPSSNPQTPITYPYIETESEPPSSAQSSIASIQNTSNNHTHNNINGFTARSLSSPRSQSPPSTSSHNIPHNIPNAPLPSQKKTPLPSSTTTTPFIPSPNLVTFTASSLEALRKLPQKRELPWRAGCELPETYEFKRPQQKGAVFLAARGDVQTRPCRICENGNGRFTLCVALDEYFGGACASCVFPSKGSQCTLRKDKGDVVKKEVEDSPVVTEPSKKRKRVSTAKVLDTPKAIETPAKKPKKADPPALKSSDLIQTDLPLQRSKQFEVQIPYEAQRHEPHAVDLLNATYKKHKNDRIPSPPLPGRNSSISTTNGLYSAHPYGQPTRPPNPSVHEGWTAVNNTRTPLPSSTPFSTPSIVNGSSSQQSQGRYQSTETERKQQKAQKVPLIDTFSKTEQRQVYGLIHGLQGGIDALNKQLGTLKGLLGIDEEI